MIKDTWYQKKFTSIFFSIQPNVTHPKRPIKVADLSRSIDPVIACNLAHRQVTYAGYQAYANKFPIKKVSIWFSASLELIYNNRKRGDEELKPLYGNHFAVNSDLLTWPPKCGDAVRFFHVNCAFLIFRTRKSSVEFVAAIGTYC